MQENERFYIKNGSNIDLKEKKSIENKYIDTLQKEKQAAFDMNETLKLTNKDKDEIISETVVAELELQMVIRNCDNVVI